MVWRKSSLARVTLTPFCEKWDAKEVSSPSLAKRNLGVVSPPLWSLNMQYDHSVLDIEQQTVIRKQRDVVLWK